MIVFLLPFAVLFPAVGLGAWWGIWRMWTHREPQFPNEFAPGNGHAPPGPLLIQADRAGLFGLAFMSAFWNLLSWPIAIVFLASAHESPWWVSLLVSIFPAIGLALLFALWKAMRAQWRIGKPVLALTEPGVPGSLPLQGQIQFDPALGTRLDAAELTHDVSVSVEYVRASRRGKNTEVSTLWHGQAVQAQFARGTSSLTFKMELPPDMPGTALSGSALTREYWQVVLETLGGKVNFSVPVRAANMDRPAPLHATAQPATSRAAEGIKTAARLHWLVQAIILLSIAYFMWEPVRDLALPAYQSWQNNSHMKSHSSGMTLLADKAQLPGIHAPFLLDSWAGNGFGVVARAAGKMQIGDNTLLLSPEFIELRSYNGCAADCPLIHSVEFVLTQAGKESFSIVAESVPMRVRQLLPDTASLPVGLPAGQPPVMLHFTDREQLAGLRLTLSIRGELMIEGKATDVSWYTHVEPFAAALGQAPARPVADGETQQMQALPAVLAGQAAELQRLLQAGADANSRDAAGKTLLMHAADRGDVGSVKLLLDHGAEVNAATALDKDGNGAFTALHAALRRDAVKVVDALIVAGADPRAAANRVWTPMHYGAYLGAAKSIRYLHEHDVGIDEPFNGARGSTPLMVAAQYEQVPAIRVLLELGADPQRKDLHGEDACAYARFFRKPAAMAALSCK
jgi:hypothetical protein